MAKLFTQAILKALPDYRGTASLSGDQIKVPVKLMTLNGAWRGYIYELDRETGFAQAFVILNGNLQFAESGAVYLGEIYGWDVDDWNFEKFCTHTPSNFLLKLERDRWFRTMSLSKIREEVANRRIP